MNTVPLEQLSFDSFQPLLQTRFRVWVDEQDAVELELVQATPPRLLAATGPHLPACESFALVFRGPAQRVLPQRIYRFESERLGRFELFIVPIGRDREGTSYEATFNRLLTGGTHLTGR